MTNAKTQNASDQSGKAKLRPGDIFRFANRGLLLDIVIFLVNLFLMRFLLGRFIGLTRAVADGDQVAGFAVFFFCVGLFVLLPLGAVLKRRRFHDRLQLKGESFNKEGVYLGCLFSPIIYLAMNLVLISVINAFLGEYLYGDKSQDHPGFFISCLLIGIALVIIQTVLVYRYFSPPKKDPWIGFFKTPASEILGDICIFANMICYQIVWNWLMWSPRTRVTGISDLFYRAVFLVAISLLVYFPPRVLYLAEDIHKRRTWITILLANAPLIYRQLIGSGTAGW